MGKKAKKICSWCSKDARVEFSGENKIGGDTQTFFACWNGTHQSKARLAVKSLNLTNVLKTFLAGRSE